MPFEKGKVSNRKGRGKGTLNKNKRQFVVALQNMFEDNADEIAGWLKEIAEGKRDPSDPKLYLTPPDPKEALNQLNRWAEYCFPKLARTEVQPLDENGNKSGGYKITVNHVKSDRTRD